MGTKAGGHRYLYARTRAGAAAVDGEHRSPPGNSPIVAGQPLLEHQLRLNELFLALREPAPADVQASGWRTFRQPPVPAVASLIPDAYVEVRHGTVVRALFVEMDLATEPLRTWTRKTERYVALARSGEFPSVFANAQFGVLVVAPSRRRLETIRWTIAATTSKLSG